MSAHAVMTRILGALFYYSPERSETRELLQCLPTLPSLYSWNDPERIAALCEQWPQPDDEALIWQFSTLFEGQGEMVAPPWGSVYLERDNLLMGESTALYRAFLRRHGIAFDGKDNEPEDQFGLMLLAWSALLERGNPNAAATLLEVHLLPWAHRYLELLKRNEISPFYARLARVATLFLNDIQQRKALRPETRRLFF
ncbi:TorD/DmsD family molecular chaperone [Trabulsiella odontotermitis]|uniref:TorD/DmsD family molecular chaperone n=1 Tax=Trabulsiella odontotermitis TaxID=379893 RepID=UPI0006BA6123|nr:molecular chaperone [Trabulsiella odontotermitis]